jgi:hypothetical protein
MQGKICATEQLRPRKRVPPNVEVALAIRYNAPQTAMLSHKQQFWLQTVDDFEVVIILLLKRYLIALCLANGAAT